eukprot:10857673-Karenia_brevis.AAC.1
MKAESEYVHEQYRHRAWHVEVGCTFKQQQLAPPPFAADEPEMAQIVYRCSMCSAVLLSKNAWWSHMRAAHQFHHPAMLFASGTSCSA